MLLSSRVGTSLRSLRKLFCTGVNYSDTLPFNSGKWLLLIFGFSVFRVCSALAPLRQRKTWICVLSETCSRKFSVVSAFGRYLQLFIRNSRSSMFPESDIVLRMRIWHDVMLSLILFLSKPERDFRTRTLPGLLIYLVDVSSQMCILDVDPARCCRVANKKGRHCKKWHIVYIWIMSPSLSTDIIYWPIVYFHQAVHGLSLNSWVKYV